MAGWVQYRGTPFVLMTTGVAFLALVDTTSALIDDKVAIASILFYRSIVVVLSAAIASSVVGGGIRPAFKRFADRRLPGWHMAQGLLFFWLVFSLLKHFVSKD
jgi:hypothetical protein